MLQIENESITDGEVVGDDLILTTRAGTPINAGNVRGPIGPEGPIGEVSDAELALAITNLDTTLRDDFPGGFITQALKTANQGPFSSIVDITDLSVNWVAAENRRYRIIAEGHFQASSGDVQVRFVIADPSNTELRYSNLLCGAATSTYLRCEHIVTPGGGSVTYKARAVGSGNVTFVAAATIYGSLTVYDVGPSS
jgi:hypothetical protein